ncbi:hypothetical protein SAMN04488021_106104 [Paracoccus aminovorans]|uniref:YdhG-like domain-containing protein n=1 Tax=Paracoccus aminovorans TaxID=34004 RepID=A0A1I2YZX3_9RHOB|nr:DUF1801 domain-containing protein [Paracoccus aminovorans]CQR85866.1 hypothetical protein JCM7685_1292 [Paracoccus aminovorans]SFH30766.1 hypothetical protein SAMN04488021_106104 [Paracoccus aminovorans]
MEQDRPRLLAGGNPQIAKGYGEAVVQAYLAAVPGWKQDACRRLDAAVTRELPSVVKAVKWNSPFYGMEKDLWFLSFHCMTRYIKLAFFRGASLQPMPPVGSRQPEVRYLHVWESEPLDEGRFADWLQQASRLPGVRM